MPAILIIDRNSVVKPYNAKVYSEEDLYKKAGFKSKEGFAKHAEWKVALKNKECVVEIYGKTNGRAGQENKYEFPPPIDNTLFFGSCVLVCKSQNDVVDISPKDWETIYDQLYGGFEDITANDTEEETDEDDEIDNRPRTKDGYVKDGFIVDDDTEEDSDYSDTVVSSKKKKTNAVKPRKASEATKKTKSKKAESSQETTTVRKHSDEIFPENIKLKVSPTEDAVVTNTIDDIYLSCTDELVEESYV